MCTHISYRSSHEVCLEVAQWWKQTMPHYVRHKLEQYKKANDPQIIPGSRGMCTISESSKAMTHGCAQTWALPHACTYFKHSALLLLHVFITPLILHVIDSPDPFLAVQISFIKNLLFIGRTWPLDDHHFLARLGSFLLMNIIVCSIVMGTESPPFLSRLSNMWDDPNYTFQVLPWSKSYNVLHISTLGKVHDVSSHY